MSQETTQAGDTRPKAAFVADRGYQAVQLRARGKTFQQVADELGMTKAGAYKAYVRQLGAMRRDTPEAASLRVAESEHLAYLREQVMPAVETGDLSAIDRAVRISERYSRLNGLDLNESRVAGALEAGAVAQLAASANLHAIIIAAMGDIGMDLEQQDRLIEAINSRLASDQQPEQDEEEPASQDLVIITGEVDNR